MKRLAIAFLISLCIVGTAHAILIPFAISAARVAVATFQATAPLVTNATARSVAVMSANRRMIVSLGNSVAAHAAVLAAYLGYQAIVESDQPGLDGGAFSTNAGMMGPSSSTTLTIPGGMSAYDYIMSRESSEYHYYGSNYLDDCWSATGEPGLYFTSPKNGLTSYDCYRSGTYSYVRDGDYDTNPPGQPAEEVMYFDLENNPTQAKTDTVVEAVKDLATTNPESFDEIVSIEDLALPITAAIPSASGKLNTVYSDGEGNVAANNQPVSAGSGGGASVTFIDVDGSVREMTLDEYRNLLIDGESPRDLGDTTAPDGADPATGSDMGAVVDAVNTLKASNQAAIDGLQTDCEKNPEAAGCKELGDVPTDPAEEFSAGAFPETIFDMSVLPVVNVGQQTVNECPDVGTFTVHGQTHDFNKTGLCTFETAIGPVVLAVAYFAALMIFAGAFQES